MDNIVSFSRKRERAIWVCACGCGTFRLLETGHSECANCLKTSNEHGGQWRTQLPGVPVDVEPIDADVQINIIDLGDAEHVVRRLLQRVEPDKLAAIIVIHSDGRETKWATNIETDEQSDWMDRKIESAKQDMLTHYRVQAKD